MRNIRAIPVPDNVGGWSVQRWAAIVFVGLIHVALIYALASGLAVRFVAQLPNVLQVDVVKSPPRAANPVPPPPSPELAAPTAPQIPIPRIAIANPPPAPHAITAVAVEKPVIAPAPLVSKPAPVIAPTPPKSIAHTHTTPPYPPLAIRLGEQGTVRLRIALDSSGIVRSVDIVKSSGSTSLDRAAVDWVSAHWRYAPATHDGKPIASSVLADVRFDLRNAR